MDAYLKLSFKPELKEEGFVNENEQYKSVKAIAPKQWWQSFLRRHPTLTFHNYFCTSNTTRVCATDNHNYD